MRYVCILEFVSYKMLNLNCLLNKIYIYIYIVKKEIYIYMYHVLEPHVLIIMGFVATPITISKTIIIKICGY